MTYQEPLDQSQDHYHNHQTKRLPTDQTVKNQMTAQKADFNLQCIQQV
jgi:hypothetical protein